MKKLILSMALLGITFSVSAQQQDASKAKTKTSWEIRQAAKMDLWQKELGLDAGQKAKINALFEAKKARSDAYRAAGTNEERVKLMIEIKEGNARLNEEITSILSPEQVVKYKELRARETGSFTAGVSAKEEDQK